MLNPFIATYIQWQKDYEEKGMTEQANQLKAVLDEYRAVAAESNDIADFTQKMMAKGLPQKASAIYSQSMTAGAENQAQQQSSASEETTESESDSFEKQKKQIDDVFANLIADVKKDKAEAELDEERAWEIPFFERMIELYDSGISYPLYLKALEEEGISDRMAQLQGIREMLELGLEANTATRNLPVQLMHEELLAAWDKLCEESPSGVPDKIIWEVTDFKIRMKHHPRKIEWELKDQIFGNLLGAIHNWIDSHTKWAPNDPRWSDMGEPLDVIMRRVKKTKFTSAGYAMELEKMLKEYFGFGWDEMFNDPVFLYMRESRDKLKNFGFMPYTDNRLDFLRYEVWPEVDPLKPPSPELIAKAEEVYGDQNIEDWSTNKDMDAEYEKMLSKLNKEEREELMYQNKLKKEFSGAGGKKTSAKEMIPPSLRK